MPSKPTKKQEIERHRELWDWCYCNPEKEKYDWPRWKRNGGDIDNLEYGAFCFPCNWVMKHCKGSCNKCFFEWPEGMYCNRNTDDATGIYFLWKTTSLSNHTNRKKYAKIIRDLPLKKDDNQEKEVNN